VKGIIFGEMTDCVQPGSSENVLSDVIQRTIGDLGIPIGFGLRSGHLAAGSQPGVTLPIGMAARLTVSDDQAVLGF